MGEEEGGGVGAEGELVARVRGAEGGREHGHGGGVGRDHGGGRTAIHAASRATGTGVPYVDAVDSQRQPGG